MQMAPPSVEALSSSLAQLRQEDLTPRSRVPEFGHGIWNDLPQDHSDESDGPSAWEQLQQLQDRISACSDVAELVDLRVDCGC